MKKDEYTDRHQAIKMRLAGQSIEQICRTLSHSREWFHKWWRRYLESGPEGLYDLTRGNRQVVNANEFDGVCPKTTNVAAYDVTAVLANDVLPNLLGVTIHYRATVTSDDFEQVQEAVTTLELGHRYVRNLYTHIEPDPDGLIHREVVYHDAGLLVSGELDQEPRARRHEHPVHGRPLDLPLRPADRREGALLVHPRPPLGPERGAVHPRLARTGGYRGAGGAAALPHRCR